MTKLKWSGAATYTAALTARGPHGAFAIQRETIKHSEQFALYIDHAAPLRAELVDVFPQLAGAKEHAQRLYSGWERDAEHESACDTAAASRAED